MSKEFKKLASTVIITAIIFFQLGMLAVIIANDKQMVETQDKYNLDYLIDSKAQYTKIWKPNSFYEINNKHYRLYIADNEGNKIREWQYFTK